MNSASRLEGLRRILAQPLFRALLALAIILCLGVLFNAEGSFFRWETHRDMLRHISRYGILACGMTLVIITGGIDLAVGSVLGLVSVLSALLMIHWGWSPLAAVPLCLLVGLCCGTTSGALISRFRVQPFIATMAMMVFARGLAKYISGGRKISQGVQTDSGFTYLDFPPFFDFLNARILGDNVAIVTLVFLACALVAGLLLARFRPGRYLYAVGGNEEAARASGINTHGIKVASYAICAGLAGLAGIVQASRITTGQPNAGISYELDAIAAVVIGGTSLSGGIGSVTGTLLGALLIGTLNNGLDLLNVSSYYQQVVKGLIIIGAVILDRRKRSR